MKGWEQTFIAYAVYVLAFYALCVATCFFAIVLPKQYGRIKEKIYGNPFGNRYMTKERERIAPEILRLTDELMQ